MDSSSPQAEGKTQDNSFSDIYAAEQANTRKVNRSSCILFALLTIASIAGFIFSLNNRLSQFSEQPDGSFPVSHWLDTWMGISGILTITFFSSTVFLINKTWPYVFRIQPVATGVMALIIILGSIVGVTKLMDTVWETNMKSWAMDRYGIEYDTINQGWTPPVIGPGGCKSNHNPFTPNGLRYSTSCDIAVSGKDTYLLVTKEGRYAAELLYTGYGYKAYKATATVQPEELPVIND